MVNMVKKVQDSDRWNSFDRFRDTTRTLVNAYETHGIQTEIHQAQTGGSIGSGRWIIQQAADIKSATMDVASPVRRRVLNYHRNPWHVVQWSAATPPSTNGCKCELTIIDSSKALAALPIGSLLGKMVLTRMDPRNHFAEFANKGAMGVVTDWPVPNHPKDTKWVKFGWGGIPLKCGATHLVGLAISTDQGDMLRSLVAQHRQVIVKVKVDIQKYVGSHDVVSGVVQGQGQPDQEIWALAHSNEPGALDNASGVAVCIEAARILEKLIHKGALQRPHRSIRMLHGYECYGFFHYLEHTKRNELPLAGVNIDTVGAKLEHCHGRLEWHATVPMSAGFVNRLGRTVFRKTLELANPGYHYHDAPFVATSDTLIGDPQYGFPCPWLTTTRREGQAMFYAPYKKPVRSLFYDQYHSSADTPALLSRSGLRACATAIAAYLYFLADADTQQASELASSETRYFINRMNRIKGRNRSAMAEYLRDAHRISITQLKRWIPPTQNAKSREAVAHFDYCLNEIDQHLKPPRKTKGRQRATKELKRVPRRTALLSPTLENTPSPIADRIEASGLEPWALFWADGVRTLAQITQCLTCEYKKPVDSKKVCQFFDAHYDLGYITWNK